MSLCIPFGGARYKIAFECLLYIVNSTEQVYCRILRKDGITDFYTGIVQVVQLCFWVITVTYDNNYTGLCT